MKKRYSFMILMAVIFLLCISPVSAKAAGNEITVNGSTSITCTGWNEFEYTFTAPETETYVIWGDVAGNATVGFSVYNEKGNLVDGGARRVQIDGEKGETYTVFIIVSGRYNEENTVVIHCNEVVALKSAATDKNRYVDFVGGYVSIDLIVDPIYADVNGQWSSSNTNVAEIYDVFNCGMETLIYCKAPGTTTITFTNSNGVTASTTLTVKQLQTITTNDKITMTLDAGDMVGFLFTAPETGCYYFDLGSNVRFNDTEDGGFRVTGEGFNPENRNGLISSATTDSNLDYGCYEGNEYLVTVTNDTAKEMTITLSVIKMPAAESIEIYGYTDTVALGAVDWFGVDFYPEHAIPENIFWESSDPSVLRIVDADSYWCDVEGVSLGTAVLTATTESGLTASITVEVVENYGYNLWGDPLELNKANKITIDDPDDFGVYEFVPTASGYYHFDHDATDDAVVGIIRNNEEDIAGYYFSADAHGFVQWLEAGQTYYIYSYYYDYEILGSYNLYVTSVPIGANTTGWANLRGGWFYFENGDPVYGWKQVGGKWYYLSFDTAIGWLEYDGNWYYMDSTGAMTTGWVQVNGNWYYMNKSGVMQTGWQKINGYWYYMSSGGVMQTGWVSVGGKWYYMNQNGVMQTGWVSVGGKWYYMASGGAMQTGWITVNGSRYYLDSKGVMQTGWQQLNGSWYYFSKGGVMQTGWVYDGGYWYYMNSAGVMQKGWVSAGGKWYYMNKSGVMQTGWVQDGGYWYYMDSKGVMVTGTQVIGGKTYIFNDHGVWIG